MAPVLKGPQTLNTAGDTSMSFAPHPAHLSLMAALTVLPLQVIVMLFLHMGELFGLA